MKKVALTLLFAALAAMPIVAQRGPRPDAPAGPPPPLAEYLQLTPAQQTAWQQAHAEFLAIVEPLHAQERAAHDALSAKLQSVLTPEQRTKFEAFEAAQKVMRERKGPPPQ
jgi:hypothetical protein